MSFRHANLRNANLEYANLLDANLEYADIEYANLEYANLEDAKLRSANLRSANLTGADLTSANLTGANLQDADLRGIKYDKNTNFTGATYNDSTYFPEILDPKKVGMLTGAVAEKAREELRRESPPFYNPICSYVGRRTICSLPP